MIYRVDIDDTICHGEDYNYADAQPIQANIDKINKLFDEGHTIIYWTARGAVTHQNWFVLTTKQLKLWGCKYHRLHCNKPYFDKIIDDRSLRIEEL